MIHLRGRVINGGCAKGLALVSPTAIGFLGGIDPETGVIVESKHPLEGQCVARRVLVFPTGKGSTVGSYTLYRLAKRGVAPAAIINAHSEAIVAVGAIIAGIPMVDKVDIAMIRTGDHVQVDGKNIVVEQSLSTGDTPPHPVFVKLGGSLITDKEREATARPELVERLAEEVRKAMHVRPDLRLVLGHGSGSFGHMVAQRYHVQSGCTDWRGYAETSAAASRLNRIVTDTFLRVGVPVLSIQPSASARCRGGEIVSLAVEPVEEALVRGLVPLLYGDVAMDELWGSTIISTETIFAYLARQLHPGRIILVGEVEGVFTADPHVDPEAHLIPVVDASTADNAETALGGSHAVDVTGGMRSKVQLMAGLVRDLPDLRISLLSGLQPGLLERALVDPDLNAGTRIIAGHGQVTARGQ